MLYTMHRRIVNSPDRIQFPCIEIPYEVDFNTHSFENAKYNVAIAVPRANKHFAWFSMRRGKTVCFILEPERQMRSFDLRIRATLAMPADIRGIQDTVLYGSIIGEDVGSSVFIVEDICLHHGECMKRVPFGEKLRSLREMMQTGILRLPIRIESGNCPGFAMPFFLPQMMALSSGADIESLQQKCVYPVCKIQYKSSTDIVPCLNRALADIRRAAQPPPPLPRGVAAQGGGSAHHPKPRINPRRGQYKQRTVFCVRADTQQDIYQLYAQVSGRKEDFYDIANIPGLRVSRLMNGIFRNIRENMNLDFAEESDDEELFQDTRPDKYVDLELAVNMECEFDARCKRWTPICIAPRGARIVQMSALV